jgi:hypothetical protein
LWSLFALLLASILRTAKRFLRGAAIVRRTQEPQIRRIVDTADGKRPDVIDLHPTS